MCQPVPRWPAWCNGVSQWVNLCESAARHRWAGRRFAKLWCDGCYCGARIFRGDRTTWGPHPKEDACPPQEGPLELQEGMFWLQDAQFGVQERLFWLQDAQFRVQEGGFWLQGVQMALQEGCFLLQERVQGLQGLLFGGRMARD